MNQEESHFSFPLCGVPRTSLDVSVSDGHRLERVANSTGLNRVTAEDFSMMFLENVSAIKRRTRVDREDCRRRFAHVVGTSLEKKRYSEDEEDDEDDQDLDIVDRKPTFLNSETRDGLTCADEMLTSLYKSLNREEKNKAFIIEICSALSLCCMGAKSHKLAVAFDLCSEGKGQLTRHGLFLFLRSFLVAVVSVQEKTSLTDEDIDRTCAQAVGIVFSAATSTDTVSFPQFASWYNGEGFMKLQWLELIDGTKWPHLITESKNGEHMTSDRNIFEFELDLQPKFYFGNKYDEIKEEDDASTNRLRILSSDVSDLMILLQDLQRDQCVPKQIARLLEAKSLGAAVINAYEAYGILAQALLTKSCTSKSIDKLTQILTLFVIEDEETDEDEDEDTEVFCDIVELAIAMSILGSGRKSEKLILGFEYLASFSNSSSHLTLKSLRIMLLAYLKIICALTSSSTTSTTRRTLNRVVSAVIDAIALYTNLADEMSTITFEEFSEWYNNGGSEIATWIELVDMEKWNALIPEQEQERDSALSTSETSETSQLLSLFTFSLERYQELNRVLMLSKFDTLDPQDVFETFADFVDGEYVSKSQYDECLRILIPVNDKNLSAEQCRKLSVTFSHVFFLFDWDNSGFVRRAEIASGLSVLTSGKKSRKLELAFDAMDLDRDGKLSSAELETYFRCFLTTLACFSGAFSHRDENEVRHLISDVSRRLVQILFDEMQSAHHLVGFEQFGQWYTQGGFDHASWLELLDLTKWHEAVASSADVKSTVHDNGVEEEEKDDDDDDAEDNEENEIVFAFSISELELTFSHFDVDSLLAIVDLSGMKHVDPDVVHDMLLNSEEDKLYRPDFDECVRTIVSKEKLDFVEREQLSQVFAEMFQTFSKNSSRVSSRLEIAIGMSFLCRGSKSRKLELAFDALDLDLDGNLDADELSTYFRCFLTALSMFSGSLVGLSDEEIRHMVIRASENLRDIVFEDLDLAGDGKISFEAFGTWYTEEGFRVVPWLELLDLRKWKE